MRTLLTLANMLMAAALTAAEPSQSVPFGSPGFEPSQMDASGRLLEDWGALGVRLSGAGVTDSAWQVQAVKLDGFVPAAQAVANRGCVKATLTAYRAPVHPAGVDVLAVRVEETQGKPARATVTLDLPAKARIGARTVRLGNRIVAALPDEAPREQEALDWGCCDESSAIAGWAKPQGKCDPAFRNIRAGMGGEPIRYRFTVRLGEEMDVVLGFCESHWEEPGRRPLACRVEGALAQQIDPIAKWGRHQPGALAFAARDENRDGRLDVVVRTAPGAADRNPILNVIWLFPKGKAPTLDKVISGAASDAALRYVDVGGPNDQSIYPPGKAEYCVDLPAGGAKEITFLAACPHGSLPAPDASAWTVDKLRRAAREVWRDWPR